MPHNIGQMFYFGEQPWHKLGVRLSQPANLTTALQAGGLDWEVEAVPIVPVGEPDSSIPHRVAVVRKDRRPGEPGRVVGVVHPGFRPLQNRQGALMFDALLGQGRAVYHTGGFLKNGEVIWLLARMPDDICVRGDDVLETYLLFSNSHDGSSAIDIRLTTVRVVCQNTLSVALHANGVARTVFRRGHNGSYELIEAQAKEFFEFSVRQSKEVEALFARLAAVRCTLEDLQSFLKQLVPDPTKPATAARNTSVRAAYETRLETLRHTRNEILAVHLNGIVDRQIAPAEETWWGALNSVTAWSDHVQTTESDRYAHSLLGSGDRLKSATLARIRASVASG